MFRSLSVAYILTCSTCLIATRAHSEIVYSGGSLIDTTTGLSWSQTLIPTSTFMATSGLPIATLDQLNALILDAGGSPGPYSSVAAGVGAWFGPSGFWVYAANYYSEGSSCTGPTNGGNCFAGIGLSYRSDDADAARWFLSYVPTASLYGPTFSLPREGWPTPYVSALVVAPVPLPGAGGLLVSGVVGFVLMRRRSLGHGTLRV